MKTRIISGIVMLPLLFVVYLGGYPLMAAAALIAFVGVSEFYSGFSNMGIKPSRPVAMAMIALLYVMYIFFGRQSDNMHFLLLLWIILSLIASFIYGWRINERGPYDSMATAIGLVYVALFSFHIVMLDELFHNMVWIVILAAFGSDIFAYFTGFFLGKHKMAPNLSPKKTIEGGIGGIIGAALLCWCFGHFADPQYQLLYLLMGIIGGVAGESGDLTASAFKRKMGIKDYGNLIPGHGGIMDRFDSVIMVAPVIYYGCSLYMMISR